jgi:hypothetical protein
MADFHPTNPQDDQIWVVVDLRNPRQPREVGRWWLPGTRQGESLFARLSTAAAQAL